MPTPEKIMSGSPSLSLASESEEPANVSSLHNSREDAKDLPEVESLPLSQESEQDDESAEEDESKSSELTKLRMQARKEELKRLRARMVGFSFASLFSEATKFCGNLEFGHQSKPSVSH